MFRTVPAIWIPSFIMLGSLVLEALEGYIMLNCASNCARFMGRVLISVPKYMEAK